MRGPGPKGEVSLLRAAAALLHALDKSNTMGWLPLRKVQSIKTIWCTGFWLCECGPQSLYTSPPPTTTHTQVPHKTRAASGEPRILPCTCGMEAGGQSIAAAVAGRDQAAANTAAASKGGSATRDSSVAGVAQ
jgi:hypothetical protein